MSDIPSIQLEIPACAESAVSTIPQVGENSVPHHAERRTDDLVALDTMRFDGATYEPDADQGRLARQMTRVRAAMLCGAWRTLDELAAATGDPPASVSARLRDLRKPRFGAFVVNRRRRGSAKRGVFEYQVLRSEVS
jgi:hypothetical protein